jgi:hypothetical protein
LKKKKTNVQPVTEKQPEPSETTNKEELITPEPAQPKPQPPIPLTPNQRIDKLEHEVEGAFKQLVERLAPVIQLSDQLAQANQQQSQQPQQNAQAQPNVLGALQELQGLVPIFQAFTGAGGGTDNRLNELAMKSLEMDIDLSRTLKGAVVSKILGGTAGTIADAVTGDKP